MPSEQEKGARRLALRSRVNQSAGSSTGVANGGVAIAGEASIAGGVSVAAEVEVVGAIAVLPGSSTWT
jgi:hypothetical protein